MVARNVRLLMPPYDLIKEGRFILKEFKRFHLPREPSQGAAPERDGRKFLAVVC